MTIDFAGRVAVVTGAGGGLGREYALELARRGAKLVVNDLGGSTAGEGNSKTAADGVVAQIRAAGGEAVASYDSVGTRAGGKAIVETALDTWGRIDVVIANAGILRNGPFEDLTDEAIDAVLNVHLKGGFYLGQPAFKAMKAQGYGRFLFTASASALFGHPWQANYAAAKAGLFGLSNVIALEGRSFGINSNALLPAARTRLGEAVGYEWRADCPEVSEAMAGLRFGGADNPRMGPDWVAPLALYLVSEACSATHGAYSTFHGRYARVFAGAAPGWLAPHGASPTPEQIAENWQQVEDQTGYSVPISVYHEMLEVSRRAEVELVSGC